MTILVTRPRDQAVATGARLADLGFEAILSPMLEIEMVSGPELAPDDYSAMIVTSSNALRGLVARWPDDRRSVDVFTTGRASRAALVDAGFSRVACHAGSGRALADHLLDQGLLRAGQTVLYPCGETRRPELEARLAAADVSVCPVITYRALPATAFVPEAEAALRAGSIEAVLLYSPRSAAVFRQLWHGMALATDELPPVFCLSAAIVSALGATLGSQAAFCDRPDEELLLDLLLQSLELQP